MNVLIVSATAAEIHSFLDHYRQHPEMGHVDVLVTGIGLVSATYHLTKQIHLKRPGLVIQAGIAGCFDRTIPLGSVVAVKQDTIGDLGVIETKELKSLPDLKLVNPDQFPYKKGWLINENKGLLKGTRLKSVKGMTVNHITTSVPMIHQYIKKFDPVTESMEGAALHYCCITENIAFLQLRAVSNYVSERNKKKWKMELAIENLNRALVDLVNTETFRIEH
jgi:futalosine hydrolase